jgi:hypothetical protein
MVNPLMSGQRDSERRQTKRYRGRTARLAVSPEVGIFWDVNGVLIIAGALLEEAERRGRFAFHPMSHERMWPCYQRINAVPSDMEYDDPPRGQVICDKVTLKFHLYADVCILRNETLVAKIRSDLHLPPKVEAAPDDHYRCAKCLAASPSDKDL